MAGRWMSQDPFFRALDKAERGIEDGVGHPHLDVLRRARIAEMCESLGEMTAEEAEEAYYAAGESELTSDQIDAIVRRVLARWKQHTNEPAREEE